MELQRSMAVKEKLDQLQQTVKAPTIGTPYDKLASEIATCMSRAASSVVIDHLAAALASVNKARLSGLQGASRT